jgi:spore germination protein KA
VPWFLAYYQHGDYAMSLDDILGQGRRLEHLIAGTQPDLDLADIRALHPPEDLDDIKVLRPDGSAVQVLFLKSSADAKRVRAEAVAPLSTSSGALDAVLPMFTPVKSTGQANQRLLSGSALVFAAGTVLAGDMPSAAMRSVQEPSTERAVFGPKDALVESISDNIGLIRGHLRDPRMRVEYLALGTDAPTDVALVYLNGVIDGHIVDEARRRIAEFQPPRVGFVSSLLRPLYGAIWDGFLPADFSERPYRIADFVARGRLAILVDGSPFAMIVPMLFVELFIDEEEYLQATSTRYFLRALKFVAFFLATFGPGFYLAVMTINPTIVPGLLAVAVASSRQSLPYPIFTETLLMLILIDILADATLTQKSTLGPAISIVGGLVAGQAAVRADLASDIGVIVVSITLLATFMTSRLYITYSVRVWKYAILAVSALFGIAGLATGMLFLIAVFTSHRQIGVQYLAPLAPLRPGGFSSRSLYRRGNPQVPTHVRKPRPSP